MLLPVARRRITMGVLSILCAGFFGLSGCMLLHGNGYPRRSPGDFPASMHHLELRFFISGGTGTPLAERVYRDTYAYGKAQRIAWELSLRCQPLDHNALVEIKAIWRFNKTDLVNVQTVFLNLEKNQTEARISASWNPRTDVGWTPGCYAVELISRKGPIIASAFTISSPPDYRPKMPATSPFLKLNTVNHHACLNEVETDGANKYMVSASNDKTVRLWDLDRYRLLRVLRPPIENGREGELRTVAISPDGKAVACGGKTGQSWYMSNVVYIFDRAMGTLTKTLTGFPNPIQDIAFSKDRDYFVVFFGDGLRVYAYPGWDLVDQVKIPFRWITRADINTKNELAIATFDGHILIYSITGGRLLHKATGTTSSGRRPISIRYSPDDKALVVTFRDTKDIDVYSAATLRYLYSPIGAGIERFLISAVWSKDGQSIYAGGVHEEYMAVGGKREKIFPIFSWGRKGKGERESIPIGCIGINALHALNDGRIVYGLYDGTWGVLDRRHQKVFTQPSSILHFRKLSKRCRISPDASKVYFQYDEYQNSGFVIDIPKGRVIPWEDISGKAPFVYPRIHHPRLDIRRWKHKRYPRLDGKPLFYHKGEISRCLAIEADGSRFVLGTNHNIYCFNRNGDILWRVPVPSVTRAVNISENGKIAVGHIGDGTIRWYRMRDGKEFLAFYPHPDRKRWIAWTPDGYYMCSPYGDDLIGWHLNNGKDGTADFYTASQFERLLYMPHYVKANFKHLGDRASIIRVNKDLEFSISKLATILPPRITIVSPEPGFVSTADTLQVKFKLQQTSRPLKDYTVYINNIPVTTAKDRWIGGAGDRFDLTIDLPLHDEKIKVRIESTGGQSMGVAETHFYTSKKQPVVKGDLYLLVVGINHFERMPTHALSFAVNDANEFAKRLRREEGLAFRRVHVRTITDDSPIKPTKKAIISQLAFFKEAGPYDTSILFLSSHGLNDHAGNYYLVPSDGSFADMRSIVKTQNRGIKPVRFVADSLIGWRSFFDIFRTIPGKRLLVVDTCHSQAISGTFDMCALAKRSASSFFALMTASKDNEASQESRRIKHGLFTYALLQGLSGEGNSNNDRQIVLSELYRYIRRFVTRHHDVKLGPQTPQIESPPELMTMVLGSDLGR
jgi:WD40 repeat protein